MTILQRYILIPLMIALMGVGGFALFSVSAQTLEEIGVDIENKEAEIDGIRNKIRQFEDRIDEYEGKQQSLANELAILENRVQKTQLDIQEAELEIDKVELEIAHTREEIVLSEKEIIRSKDMIAVVLRELYTFDEAGPVEVLFGNEVFSEFFDQVQYLETLQDDLSNTLERIETLNAQLKTQEEQQASRKERLVSMRQDLERTQRRLESEQRAKDVLLASAEQSEAQFRVLVRELQEERQYIQSQVFRLQEELNRRIEEGDLDEEVIEELTGPTILSWPVQDPIITAIFHDPTYPFKHLFQHSGVDMAVPQGSTLRAAGPGYVAWAKSTSRGYGNHIMIVHSNGIATLYAHLSQMNVAADQFVQRGEVIGKTGGLPGTPGAGLSTGPHLHFEVREDGIPVDPYLYLVD